MCQEKSAPEKQLDPHVIITGQTLQVGAHCEQLESP
jgi:hypothetical protein